jgi:L-iditol 2-dehydrogenase
MKAGVIYDYCDIRVEDVPRPKAGPGEVLVKTAVCGICSGDVMDWYIRKKKGTVLGHEPSGTVVEVGKGVKGFVPGDRVFAHHHAPCGACELCESGRHVQCDSWHEAGIEPGGMAEYFKVLPDAVARDMHKLPDHVSFDGGALVEPLACVVKGFSRVPDCCKAGTVVVTGMGVMGVLNVLAARHYGARQIIAADLVDSRVSRSLSFGADTAVNVSEHSLAEAVSKATDGRMADLVIVGPASLKAMEEGIECAGRGGVVLLFSPAGPGQLLSIDVDSLYFKDISLITSYSCGPTDTKEALSLISQKVVDPQAIVSHRYDLDHINEAYCLAAKGEESLKVMIDVDPGRQGL